MPSAAEVEAKLREIRGYAPLFRAAFPGDPEPVTAANFARAVGAFERTLVTPSPFDAFLEGRPDVLDDREKRGLRGFVEAGCATCHSGAYLGGQVYRKFGLLEAYWKHTGSEPVDEGRFTVTKNEAERFVFKVPVLRNVARTSPYFHDGSVDALGKAVQIMGRVQLGKSLSDREVRDIEAFLKSLTGKIPDDALRIPLLPPS